MATTNPWKQFESLLPKAHCTIGTVTNQNNDGSNTITLRNGSSIIIKGENLDVGRKVLIENGEVIKEVPDLPMFHVQI